jgi:hypothetical protein
LKFGRSFGDGVRLEGGFNCNAWDISTYEIGVGHDLLHFNDVANSIIHDVNCKLRTSNAIRLRSCNNIEIYNVFADGFTNASWSPGIQAESIRTGDVSTKISIHDCTLYGTFGAGILLAGTVKGNKDVSIYNNMFIECGRMPANVNPPKPYVGGITTDGFDNVRIINNTFYQCCGNAISNAFYTTDCKFSGLTATITGNILYGTQKSLKP